MINWTRINNDTNGNPRYVCHFSNILTDNQSRSLTDVVAKYNQAIRNAKKIGGRKFHNKKYGGGIVFQSYNIDKTEASIKELLNELSNN